MNTKFNTNKSATEKFGKSNSGKKKSATEKMHSLKSAFQKINKKHSAKGIEDFQGNDETFLFI